MSRVRERVRALTVVRYRGRRVTGSVLHDPPEGWLVKLVSIEEVDDVRQWKRPTKRQLKWAVLDKYLKEQGVP